MGIEVEGAVFPHWTDFHKRAVDRLPEAAGGTRGTSCWQGASGHPGWRLQMGGPWSELAPDMFSLATLLLAHKVFLKFLN